MCAGGLATLALARGSDLVLRIGIRGTAVALLALIAALVLGWPRLVTLALVLVGAAYGLYLGVDGPALDPAAPAFAAGLFLTAELAHWSLEDRENVKAEPGENLRRVAIVAGLAGAVVVVSGALLALADVARTRGLAVDLLGAAAAAATLLVVALFARKSTG